MKRSSLIAMLAAAWFAAACSSGTDGPGPDAGGTGTGTGTLATHEARVEALGKSGVPVPDAGVEPLDPLAIAAASQAAAATPGSRGAFQTFHDTVAPLLPTGGLRLASTKDLATCQTADGNATGTTPCRDAGAGGGGDAGGGGGGAADPGACPRVCATACASASATAAAAAFAHASVQACAFAQAWACVYESVAPFSRVCAWARSQACVSAFATAFGFGFAVANDQECRTVCSDGTVTVTNGPAPANGGAPANGAVPAEKSLLRPST
jgi:hypothetical protein